MRNVRPQLLRVIAASGALPLILTLAAVVAVVDARAERVLTFDEEFSSAGLNKAIWTPGWQKEGISEISGQCVSSENYSQPGDGYLYLELRERPKVCGATVESNPADGVSGHSGFSYSTGYVEWRVYVPGIEPVGLGCPKGGCLPDWPAVWTLAEHTNNEIDTMEGLGRLGQACYHIHPPPGSEGPGGCVSGSYAGWHTYGSQWEPGAVTYYYDGAQVGRVVSSSVNTNPQFLIMTMITSGCCGGPYQVPDSMAVDYVRVWEQPPAPSSSTWAVPNSLGTTLNAFFEDTSARLDVQYYTQVGGWGHATLENGISGIPAAIENVAANDINVFYRNTSGQLAQQYVTSTSGWHHVVLESADSGNPAAVESTDGNASDVFYANTSGQLAHQYWRSASSWTHEVLESGINGTPTAIENVPANNINVFYENTSGQLAQQYWNLSNGWHHTVLENGLSGTPTAIENTAGNNINVFYANTSGQLAQQYWTYSGGWGHAVLENGLSGTPTAIENQAGNAINVFYRNTSGQLAQQYWTSTEGWHHVVLANGDAGSPSAIENAEGINVFYRNTSGQLVDESWTRSGGWASAVLANEMAGP